MDAELRELCERLRGLLAMAVPAPWGLCQNPPNEHWLAGITIGSKSPKDARRIADICTQGARGDDIQPTHAANAELIVAAVNALPRILDTLAAQAAELEWLGDGVERLINEKSDLRVELLNAQAELEGVRAKLAACKEVVPTNWCDSLLTGPNGIGTPPYNCASIERLLLNIRQRIDDTAISDSGAGGGA